MWSEKKNLEVGGPCGFLHCPAGEGTRFNLQTLTPPLGAREHPTSPAALLADGWCVYDSRVAVALHQEEKIALGFKLK